MKGKPSGQADLVRAAAGQLGISIRALGDLLEIPNRTIYGWTCDDAPMPPVARILAGLIRDGKVARIDIEEAK